MSTRLRIYHAPEGDDTATLPPEPEVRVRLGDLLPLAAVAQRMNFVWLKDFLEDDVMISQDLYEVLQAFRSTRPTSA